MNSSTDKIKLTEILFEKLLENLKKVYKKKLITPDMIKNIIERDNLEYLNDIQ